jgi:hypothetical protein
LKGVTARFFFSKIKKRQVGGFFHRKGNRQGEGRCGRDIRKLRGKGKYNRSVELRDAGADELNPAFSGFAWSDNVYKPDFNIRRLLSIEK